MRGQGRFGTASQLMARRAVLPIFIPHLGCPNACVFCDQRRISGSPVPASGKSAAEILEHFRASGGRGAELAYYGGSFTAIPVPLQEELLEAARPYLADGTLCSIRVSTRPDAVDADAVERLRRSGVETVELGAQSMCDRVLLLSGRGHTARDTVDAVGLLRPAGFRVILQMMTGLPGADHDADVETAEKLLALHPDGVRIYPTVIIRGTALEQMWRDGLYCEHTTEDAVALCAEIVPMFEEAGIPVIRIGLNPTEELSTGAAAGGAYHPALGELVRSEIIFCQVTEKLREQNLPEGAAVVISVPPDRISVTIGQHRKNLLRWQERFPGRSFRVSGKGPYGIFADRKRPNI